MNQCADSWKSNLGPIVTKPPKDGQVGFRVTLLAQQPVSRLAVFFPRVQIVDFNLSVRSALTPTERPARSPRPDPPVRRQKRARSARIRALRFPHPVHPELSHRRAPDLAAFAGSRRGCRTEDSPALR
jgi:hypothetical protein